MTIDIQHVQPGDLITASFFNGLIEELAALDTRLARLEGATTSNAVVITALDSSIVHVGDTLVISGQNFGFSLGAHRVRFNGVSPTAFLPGSSDTVLKVQVPPIPGLPPNGSQVTLTVNNVALEGPGAAASRTITVLPAQVPQAGNIDILFEDVTPDPLTAGTTNDFRFRLSSDATLPAVVSLATRIAIAGQPASWPMTALDVSNAPLESASVTLAPGQELPIVVRVAIPAQANGTVFNLTVEGAAPGLALASAGLPPMTVGQHADPDPTFTMSPTPSSGQSGTVAGSKITSPVAAQFTPVSVESQFSVPGSYAVVLETLPGTTGWNAAMNDPAPGSPPFEITQSDLNAGGKRTLRFRVHPTSAAATSHGQLRLTVQRQGESRVRSYTFELNPA